MVSGVMDIFTSSQNHKNEDFSICWKMKRKSYWSTLKQNNPSDLLGYPFFQIRDKHGPADPIRPKLDISPIFPDFL